MNAGFDLLTDRTSIVANKQGSVTDQQRELLGLASGLTFWYALGATVVIVGIVAWAMTQQMADLPANALAIPGYFWIVLAFVIGAPLLYLGWQMVRTSRVRRELASGSIMSEEGHVEWKGWRYRVALSVSGLRSIYGQLNLMPGRYRFYLLPGSRYLLSADPLDTPQAYCAALTDALGKVFRFTNDDLTANREGRLSPAQMTRLRSSAIRTGLGATVFMAVLAGAMVIAVTLGSAWYLVLPGIWFLICLCVLPSMIRYSIEQLRERNGKTAFVQGPGSREFHNRSRSVIKYYLVNNVRFDVSGRAYNAMVEGATYRIYYTSRNKTILCVEALSADGTPQ